VVLGRWRKNRSGTPDPHASDPVERARGIRFVAAAELTLLSAGEPWQLYKGRSGERIGAAVAQARAAVDAAAVVDRPDVPARQALPLAEAAQAAVTHLHDVLGEVRRATVQRVRLADEAEHAGQAAATAVARAAADGHEVEPLVRRLQEASRLLDDAEDAGADPLTAAAALERSLSIVQQVTVDTADLPFRRQRLEREVDGLDERLAELRRRAAEAQTHRDRLAHRWSAASLAPLDGLAGDVARLLTLAAEHRDGARRACTEQQWDAVEAASSAARAALEDADGLLARPARLDADLAARVTAARERADGARTVLRWNRTTRPQWSAALAELEERLDAALTALATPPVDVARGEAGVATVAAEVEQLDRARLEQEQRAGADQAWEGEVWGQGGDQPWGQPGSPPPWGRGPWGR
jgi:hypothetical protein